MNYEKWALTDQNSVRPKASLLKQCLLV